MFIERASTIDTTVVARGYINVFLEGISGYYLESCRLSLTRSGGCAIVCTSPIERTKDGDWLIRIVNANDVAGEVIGEIIGTYRLI